MQARESSRSNFYHYSSVYSRTEMHEYFASLNNMLSQNRQHLSSHIKFTFTNGHDTLKLAYSPTDNNWLIKISGHYHVLDGDDMGKTLASRVSQHFGITNNLSDSKANLVLGTIINAKCNDHVSLKHAVCGWMSEPAWSALHMPNKTKANVRDIHKNTWLKLAVVMGEPELVVELHKLMRFYKKDRKQLALSSLVLAAAIGGLIASSVLVNPAGIAVCAALIFFEVLDWKYSVKKREMKRIEAAILNHREFETANSGNSDLSSIATIMSHLSEEDRIVAINKLREYVDAGVVPETLSVLSQEPVQPQPSLERVLCDTYTPSPKFGCN